MFDPNCFSNWTRRGVWRGGPGFGNFGFEGFPFGPGRGRGGWRGGRVFDQGDLKYVILQLLAEKPRHGYEIIKAIEEQVAGAYSPSPGVIYPTLTLLEELGYQATFRAVPDDQWMATVGDSSRNVQISLAGWEADIPRPSDFFVPVLSCHSFDHHLAGAANLAGFCDPHIDQLVNMAQAAQLTDPGAFRKLWAQIDHLVTGQAPWVPILNIGGSVFVSARVGNFQDSLYYGGPLLDQMWVQ